MAEQFSNNAVGNLNANITSGATSLVLQAGQGALFPAAGNFRIVIGAEIIIVGARSGDTLSSLTRGGSIVGADAGTASAAHNSGDVVTHALTAGALGVFTQTGAGLAGPPGTELTYNEYTVPVSITATTEATANTVVTASAFTFDGATATLIEYWAPYFTTPAAIVQTQFVLYDGSSSIGLFGYVSSPAASAMGIPVRLQRKLTPSNASHTYSIRCFMSSGTGSAGAGVGGSGFWMPGYIRITKA